MNLGNVAHLPDQTLASIVLLVTDSLVSLHWPLFGVALF